MMDRVPATTAPGRGRTFLVSACSQAGAIKAVSTCVVLICGLMSCVFLTCDFMSYVFLTCSFTSCTLLFLSIGKKRKKKGVKPQMLKYYNPLSSILEVIHLLDEK